MRRLQLPYRGVSDATPFIDQPGDTCAFERMSNMLPTDDGSGRFVLSSRPGLEKLYPQQLPGPPQGATTVTKASNISGFEIGACVDMGAGRSTRAAALSGQVWCIDQAPSMVWEHYLDVTGLTPAGPANNACNAICAHPAGPWVAVASNYTRGGVSAYSIRTLNIETGQVGDTEHVYTAGVNRSVRSLCASRIGLFVFAVNASGVPCIVQYRFNEVTGELLLVAEGGATASPHTLYLWASETIQGGVYTDTDGSEYLIAAFNGASNTGTIVDTGGSFGSTTITPGKYAQHFRSGLMKFRLNALGMQRVAYGTGLAAGADGYEANHNYWRYSEHTFPITSPARTRGWGCLITACAVGSDGAVAFTRTNQGYGPNNSFLPNNATPYITVVKISPTGVLQWETDPSPIHESGVDGYNDIPFSGDPTIVPSLQAVAIDPQGHVYVAGRYSSGGSVFKLDGATGIELWRNAVVAGDPANVRRFAIAIDPTDGNVIVGGTRNDDWDAPSSGNNRHLFKLNRQNGDVMTTFDLAEDDKNGLGVATTGVAAGKVVYITEKV